MLAQKQIHGLSQCKQEKSSANCTHGCYWLQNWGTFRNIPVLRQDYSLRLIPQTEVRPVFSSVTTCAVNMLKKCGIKGRWIQCCCLLSAGGPGLLPTVNSCSKYGCCFLWGLMLCCDSISPSRVHPTGIPLQTMKIFLLKIFPRPSLVLSIWCSNQLAYCFPRLIIQKYHYCLCPEFLQRHLKELVQLRAQYLAHGFQGSHEVRLLWTNTGSFFPLFSTRKRIYKESLALQKSAPRTAPVILRRGGLQAGVGQGFAQGAHLCSAHWMSPGRRGEQGRLIGWI